MAWRLLKGIGAVVAFALAWTGLTGPELLNEVGDELNLSFVASDAFRSVLVLVGVAVLITLAVSISRRRPQSARPAGRKPIRDVGPPTEPSRGAPATSAAEDTGPPSEERVRVFMPLTPEDIAEMCRGRTTVQARNLLSEHFDQWMKVEGNVANFTPLLRGTYVLNLNRPGSRVIVSALFRDMERWKPRLSILNRGDRVRVEGKLVDADEGSISLDYCEVSLQPPSPPASSA